MHVFAAPLKLAIAQTPAAIGRSNVFSAGITVRRLRCHYAFTEVLLNG